MGDRREGSTVTRKQRMPSSRAEAAAQAQAGSPWERGRPRRAKALRKDRYPQAVRPRKAQTPKAHRATSSPRGVTWSFPTEEKRRVFRSRTGPGRATAWVKAGSSTGSRHRPTTTPTKSSRGHTPKSFTSRRLFWARHSRPMRALAHTRDSRAV